MPCSLPTRLNFRSQLADVLEKCPLPQPISQKISFFTAVYNLLSKGPLVSSCIALYAEGSSNFVKLLLGPICNIGIFLLGPFVLVIEIDLYLAIVNATKVCIHNYLHISVHPACSLAYHS